MLARVIEVIIRGGKKQEVISIVQNELLPLLQRQPGFISHETMTRQTDPNVAVATTCWRTHDEAEEFYSSQDYTTLLSRLRPLFGSDIRPVFYNVEVSTALKASQGKAA